MATYLSYDDVFGRRLLHGTFLQESDNDDNDDNNNGRQLFHIMFFLSLSTLDGFVVLVVICQNLREVLTLKYSDVNLAVASADGLFDRRISYLFVN